MSCMGIQTIQLNLTVQFFVAFAIRINIFYFFYRCYYKQYFKMRISVESEDILGHMRLIMNQDSSP